jgi:inhibitor of KinA sporulation pathway (predicted exonuclease)
LSDAQLDVSSASAFDTEWEELIDWYARERTPRYQQTKRSTGSGRAE